MHSDRNLGLRWLSFRNHARSCNQVRCAIRYRPLTTHQVNIDKFHSKKMLFCPFSMLTLFYRIIKILDLMSLSHSASSVKCVHFVLISLAVFKLQISCLLRISIPGSIFSIFKVPNFEKKSLKQTSFKAPQTSFKYFKIFQREFFFHLL